MEDPSGWKRAGAATGEQDTRQEGGGSLEEGHRRGVRRCWRSLRLPPGGRPGVAVVDDTSVKPPSDGGGAQLGVRAGSGTQAGAVAGFGAGVGAGSGA